MITAQTIQETFPISAQSMDIDFLSYLAEEINHLPFLVSTTEDWNAAFTSLQTKYSNKMIELNKEYKEMKEKGNYSKYEEDGIFADLGGYEDTISITKSMQEEIAA